MYHVLRTSIYVYVSEQFHSGTSMMREILQKNFSYEITLETENARNLLSIWKCMWKLNVRERMDGMLCVLSARGRMWRFVLHTTMNECSISILRYLLSQSQSNLKPTKRTNGKWMFYEYTLYTYTHISNEMTENNLMNNRKCNTIFSSGRFSCNIHHSIRNYKSIVWWYIFIYLSPVSLSFSLILSAVWAAVEGRSSI